MGESSTATATCRQQPRRRGRRRPKQLRPQPREAGDAAQTGAGATAGNQRRTERGSQRGSTDAGTERAGGHGERGGAPAQPPPRAAAGGLASGRSPPPSSPTPRGLCPAAATGDGEGGRLWRRCWRWALGFAPPRVEATRRRTLDRRRDVSEPVRIFLSINFSTASTRSPQSTRRRFRSKSPPQHRAFDLSSRESPSRSTNEGLSKSEIAIRDALYWPDGKRKYSSRSNPVKDHMGLLVQALLDKYNEENALLGDCAYQVEKVVAFQEVYEGEAGWYYHLNCIRKTNGGVASLFFAEVSKTKRGQLEEFELTCLHMLKYVDNGRCYGCTSVAIGVKHPIKAGKYKGGHDRRWPRRSGSHPLDFPGVHRDDPLAFPKDMDAWFKAEEERIKFLYGDDDDVAKLDARRTPACSVMSQGRSRKDVLPPARWQSDAGRTPPCSDMSQGRSRKYVVPVRPQSDAGRTPACSGRSLKYVVPARRHLV